MNSSLRSGARCPLVAEAMATTSHLVDASLLLVHRIRLGFSSCYHPVLQWIKRHSTFYRLHVAYFLFFGLIGSLSLWLSPKPDSLPPLSFVDALFNAVSAVTVTGLSSVEMHRYSASDQVTLLLLMIMGSQVFTSVFPLFVRRLRSSSNDFLGRAASTLNNRSAKFMGSKLEFSEPAGTELSLRKAKSMPPLKQNYIVKAIELKPHESSPAEEGTRAEHTVKIIQVNSTFTADVNSFVYPPKSQELRSAADEAADVKKETRVLETRVLEEEALRTLGWVVLGYLIGAQMIGFVICELYFKGSPTSSAVLTQRHINRGFFSLFSTVSSFANAGYILLDDNLVPFRRSSILLVCLGVLVLVGNTMYAPTLRVVIWLLYQSSTGRKRLIYRYLLRNPRRCYTHLFPRSETLWLVLTVAAFNAAQIICICGLNWNSPVLEGLSPAYKLIDGLFQSLTTRNAGMNVVDIEVLSAPTLFLLAGMMYVSVYPVYVTRQHSKATARKGSEGARENPETDIYVQSRNLLARDSVYLFVSMFFICLTERNAAQSDPLNFSVFKIMFETISAYGNVGLSMGYSCSKWQRISASGPLAASCIDVSNSFVGTWSITGKLILVVVMLLGRHRGLPDNRDRAIAPPPLPNPEQPAMFERPGLPLAKPASASCTKRSASFKAVSPLDATSEGC